MNEEAIIIPSPQEPEKPECRVCFEPLTMGQVQLCGNNHAICLVCFNRYLDAACFQGNEHRIQCPTCRQRSVFTPIIIYQPSFQVMQTSYGLYKHKKRWVIQIAQYVDHNPSNNSIVLPIHIQYAPGIKKRLSQAYLKPLFNDNIRKIITDLIIRDSVDDRSFVPVSIVWPGLFWRINQQNSSKVIEIDVRAELPSKRQRSKIYFQSFLGFYSGSSSSGEQGSSEEDA